MNNEELAKIERKIKILCVEDDKMNLKLIEKVLGRDVSLEIELVDNGYSAINAFHYFKPDIVLVDHFLPHINGGALINFFRERESKSNCLFVVMSGLSKELVRLHSDVKYDFEHIKKPFNPNTISLDLINMFRGKFGELKVA